MNPLWQSKGFHQLYMFLCRYTNKKVSSLILLVVSVHPIPFIFCCKNVTKWWYLIGMCLFTLFWRYKLLWSIIPHVGMCYDWRVVCVMVKESLGLNIIYISIQKTISICIRLLYIIWIMSCLQLQFSLFFAFFTGKNSSIYYYRPPVLNPVRFTSSN